MIEFEQICSRELLMKKAAEIEKTISVKEHKRERHDFGLTTFRWRTSVRVNNFRILCHQLLMKGEGGVKLW